MSTTAPHDTRLAPEDIAALRSRVHGTVVERGDNSYADSVQLFNAAITHRPAVLVTVTGPTDVAAVLQLATARHLSISVRGGGHGLTGNALAGDVVIDLSSLRGITVDPISRTAVVRGGSTWGEVDAATQAHGLAVPGGRITHTGVGGLTLGGGEGWLSPKYGLTCDNLLSVELVTADGRIVVASETDEPELFWALRGGGGNFGVVTSFTFRLHPVGPLVLGGLLLYRLDDAPDVLTVLAQLSAADHDDLAAAAIFMAAPPAPFVPGNVVGRPVLAIVPAWLGDLELGAEVLRPFRERVHPIVDAAGPMPYLALQAMTDESAPYGFRQQWSASFLEVLPARLIADLVDAAASLPSPQSHIIVGPVGGAITRAPADATAYPHRRASWLVHPVAQWADSAHDDTAVAWVRELGAHVRSYSEIGTYLNVDDDTAERVRWAFGEERYLRLQRVKTAWDPDDVFRHCAHIPPASSRA